MRVFYLMLIWKMYDLHSIKSNNKKKPDIFTSKIQLKTMIVLDNNSFQNPFESKRNVFPI